MMMIEHYRDFRLIYVKKNVKTNWKKETKISGVIERKPQFMILSTYLILQVSLLDGLWKWMKLWERKN